MRHALVLSLALFATWSTACVPSRTHESPADASMLAHDAALPIDEPDLGAPPDLATDMAHAPLLGCGSIVLCLNACGADLQCVSRCPAIGTTMARELFRALIVCLLGDPDSSTPGACPSFGGGVCDPNAKGFDQRACSDCQQLAQSFDGECFNALADCDLNCEQSSECKSDPQARCIDHICQLP